MLCYSLQQTGEIISKTRKTELTVRLAIRISVHGGEREVRVTARAHAERDARLVADRHLRQVLIVVDGWRHHRDVVLCGKSDRGWRMLGCLLRAFCKFLFLYSCMVGVKDCLTGLPFVADFGKEVWSRIALELVSTVKYVASGTLFGYVSLRQHSRMGWSLLSSEVSCTLLSP